ncbi:hypothetical protein BDU57DRAFT_598298 [Ampelomyces quisqualis]|uniref:Uncharacterized protein n=1 Tax=Ampelomyces quisqualis TaxID=50730 RepID=A0A6A5Q9Q4_AMPQU|nr:hypothetical protein BDU57DRAFT_598298 [Ampelomyces quisqualis]
MFHFPRIPTQPLPADEEANISIIVSPPLFDPPSLNQPSTKKHELELRQKTRHPPATHPRQQPHRRPNILRALHAHIPRKTNTGPETFKNLLNNSDASASAASSSAQIQSITHLAPVLHAQRRGAEPETPPSPLGPRASAPHVMPPICCRATSSLASRLRSTTRPRPSADKYSLRQTHFYPPSAARREAHFVHCATVEEVDRSLAGYAAGCAGRRVFVDGRREECWVRAWEGRGMGV